MIFTLRKQKRIEIPVWLKAANGESCTWPGCGKKNSTIVPAHSNMQIHGKGVGKKSHDLFIAFLCQSCHHEYDYGKNLSQAEKNDRFFRAMSQTWIRLYQLNLLRDAICKNP